MHPRKISYDRKVSGIACVFLSYGGSSLLVSMISIGLILRISSLNDTNS
ncbi:MAG TPA: FtsW/RodA/SpoVE family cell cycle protein [Candidatus Coprovivens excrementavium]|nr:FtsW/RodA/SpoVE family cell cycle protein [Candidatus Coprovivens excrementavium]